MWLSRRDAVCAKATLLTVTVLYNVVCTLRKNVQSLWLNQRRRSSNYRVALTGANHTSSGSAATTGWHQNEPINVAVCNVYDDHSILQ